MGVGGEVQKGTPMERAFFALKNCFLVVWPEGDLRDSWVGW